MPIREKAIIGAPCWIELDSSAVPAARAFYSELFGWGSEEPNLDFGGYFNFTLGAEKIAGGTATPEGMPDVWSTYLATDDIARTLDDAKAHGGQVILEATSGSWASSATRPAGTSASGSPASTRDSAS